LKSAPFITLHRLLFLPTRRVLLRTASVLALASVSLAATAQAPVSFPGKTPVGQTSSSSVTVTVTVEVAGTATGVVGATQGAVTPDFQVTSPGTCTPRSYNVGDQCTATVVFTPQYPGLRSGAATLVTSSGAILGQGIVNGIATGGLGVLTSGIISTIAGDGNWLYDGDGRPATQTAIFLPQGIAKDATGQTYISDTSNNRIRRIDITGKIFTYAGTGNPGATGDGGLALNAELNQPTALVLDGGGNLYIVDTGNDCIRRVDAITTDITTVAGVCGTEGSSGNGVPANTAHLNAPEGLAMDMAGNLYISDTSNNLIRKVSATDGTITTFAGILGQFADNGDKILATAASLNTPWGLAIGPDNALYLADQAHFRVRRIDLTTNIITAYAGNGVQGNSADGNVATQSRLFSPASLAFDPAGDLYIGDGGSNLVLEVITNASDINIITTVAGGTTTGGGYGDGGSATLSNLYGPYALFLDQTGNLLIADMFHNRVREINSNALTLAFASIRVGKTSLPVSRGYQNIGNDTLNIKAFALDSAALDSVSTTCVIGALASAQPCVLGVEFAPTVVSTGPDISGSISVQTDAPNTPEVITVHGQVLSVNPTSLILSSSKNPSQIGDSVLLTAVISSSDSGLGGTVTFLDGATKLCDAVTVAANQATCTVSNFALGSHSLTANYAGDPNNAAATGTLTQVVEQASATGLVVTPSPAIVTSLVTLTATVTAPTGTPTGNVIFYDGTTALRTVTVDPQGHAVFTSSTLAAGTHSFTAVYSGDTTNFTSTSAAFSELIKLASTSTMLSTSADTVPVGTSVTFTATVTSSISVTPTGSVQFFDGANLLGPAVTLVNGIATYTTAALAPTPPPHSITAKYLADDKNDISTSAPLTETVQQIPTVTNLSSDFNPANAGQVVTLSASVTMAPGSTADGAITGTVTFNDGTTSLGTATLDANGHASLPTSTLSVNTHSITVTYNSNTNYAASTSTALSLVIKATATNTVLTAPGSTLTGKTVNLSATVTTATGTPTGSVTFFDGTTPLGTRPLNAAGVAMLSSTTLPTGSHNLTAVYSGDNNYTTSTSSIVSAVIVQAQPGLTLVGPSQPANAGTSIQLTSVLTSNGVSPTGSLTLSEGATSLATQKVTATGTFPFALSTLSVGSHQLTVAYSGDTNNATVTSNTITVTVQQGNTNTALLTSANPQVLGQSVTFSATVTSPSPNITGTVSFNDGSTPLGSVPVAANGTATFPTSSLTFGLHSITAVYSGDTAHSGSTAPAISQRIVQQASIGLSSNSNPATTGTAVSFTVKLAGNSSTLPSGTVKLLDGTSLLNTVTLDPTGAATYTTSTLGIGSHSITAVYAGDTNYSAVTSTALIETINNANTSIALTSSVNPGTYGTPLTLTAAVTSNGGIATGSIVFTENGKQIGTGVLNAAGTAIFTTSSLSPGAHTIIANYAGDGKATASVSSPLVLVVKQATSVALASSANPSPTLSSITFTASVTNASQDVAAGIVTFTDGATTLGTATLDANGNATITVPQLSAGSHSIVASYAGNNTNFASASAALSQSISKRPTTTTLSATVSPTNSQQVTLIGVVRWTNSTTVPTGSIIFTNGSVTVGTAPLDATGVATLVIDNTLNNQSVIATYSGDDVYAGSASAPTTIAPQQQAQFTLTLSPASMSLASKQHATTMLTITSPNNFADNLEYGCLGLPFAATCTFSQTTGDLKAGASVQVKLTVDTGDPLGAGAQASLASHTTNTVLECFLPGTLLCGLFLFRRRKLKLATLFVLLLAVGTIFSTTGCGGLNVNGTPAGNYTFQVTARGQGSNVTESQTMTLTVTQ
jgi:hypothetical protein